MSNETPEPTTFVGAIFEEFDADKTGDVEQVGLVLGDQSAIVIRPIIDPNSGENMLHVAISRLPLEQVAELFDVLSLAITAGLAEQEEETFVLTDKGAEAVETMMKSEDSDV